MGLRISGNVGWNGEITQDELIKHRWENKHPAFTLQCYGSQGGFGGGSFRAKVHRVLCAVFELNRDL